ncbi:hypothetical protein Rsub_10885 [Raphidocelis subcapitata]|uniref:BHLH domain-containing protein n=1 Tax=Raphidocelis subcapitata TaxID=307507 RepID=A0A2V0PCZ4_9CHLO|nr:hypothetical protein Rsub_10885 [Raphidocelis subcapitata]|eukprot:GBF97721.1 hypothetical protein Rsub_10885 [Raphidocelis subcapitata]
MDFQAAMALAAMGEGRSGAGDPCGAQPPAAHGAPVAGGKPAAGRGGGRARSGNSQSSQYASRHQAAEQRRRTRINERLETLRGMVPHAQRANTASFLEEVIKFIEQLQRRNCELEQAISDATGAASPPGGGGAPNGGGLAAAHGGPSSQPQPMEVFECGEQQQEQEWQEEGQPGGFEAPFPGWPHPPIGAPLGAGGGGGGSAFADTAAAAAAAALAAVVSAAAAAAAAPPTQLPVLLGSPVGPPPQPPLAAAGLSMERLDGGSAADALGGQGPLGQLLAAQVQVLAGQQQQEQQKLQQLQQQQRVAQLLGQLLTHHQPLLPLGAARGDDAAPPAAPTALGLVYGQALPSELLRLLRESAPSTPPAAHSSPLPLPSTAGAALEAGSAWAAGAQRGSPGAANGAVDAEVPPPAAAFEGQSSASPASGGLLRLRDPCRRGGA